MNIRDYIRISEENTKLGRIPNVSLPPIKTCINNAPCADECYAFRYYKRWVTAKNAHDMNLRTYQNDPELYFNCIDYYLKQSKPKYFRWHVSGDIPDMYYLQQMYALSMAHNETKFLVFTKRYKFIEYSYKGLTKTLLDKYSNLSIILSTWVELELPSYELRQELPIAFIEDDDRKNNYIECSGSCDECFKCWELKEKGKNVCLKKI